jgi:hypothetical protein
MIRGIAATPTSAPAQTRQTPDNKELLYSFLDTGDTAGGYAMWFQLAGCAPPATPLP